MKVVLLTPWLSPHELPLARNLAALLEGRGFQYLYLNPPPPNHVKWGWDKLQTGEWCRQTTLDDEAIQKCDVLMVGGFRPIDLMEQRQLKGLQTFYVSERWFKPLHGLPGYLRMSIPSYRKMAKRLVKWVNNDPNALIFAEGVWAKRDFLRIGVQSEKLVDWGYFVEPSKRRATHSQHVGGCLKLLWVGRLLRLKHVDTIIRAVREVVQRSKLKVQLTIVGDGTERPWLQKLATGLPITFNSPVHVDEVRELMYNYDCYVFASDTNEGWGAVVSEALEEGMRVIGTFEAGASATMLPVERLYHSGDWRRLANLLELEYNGKLPPCEIGDWTAAKAARRLVEIIQK